MEPETLGEVPSSPVKEHEVEEEEPLDGDSTPADSASLDKKEETPSLTPTTNVRPTRDRKLVDRYSVPSASKPNPKKPISIDKGRGTQLKDIPNVAFKLSKRKADDNLHLLHTILFGKKGKAQTLKRNIGRFSGFVWAKDEEKQRTRVKEKLDKCVKDKLIDFCDVLNIPINKAVVRKEDLSAKLLDFLESPQSTTDVVLFDKEQKGQKRKRSVTPGKPSASKEASSDVTEKKQKRVLNSVKNQRKSSQSDEDDVNDESKTDNSEDENHTGDDAVALSKGGGEDEKARAGEEEDQPTAHGPDKNASHKDMENEESKGNDEVKAETKVAPSKYSKNKSSSSSKKGTSDTSVGKSLSKAGESASEKQKSGKRNQKDEGASKMKSSGKKQPNKSTVKALVKDEGKGKNKKKAKSEPSREEMHAVVVDILKEVDFNTATLSDILKQLGEHFGMDLMHRKTELKDIITEVINNMTDDEDDGEEADNNAEAGRDDVGGDEGRENQD
ncbi:hypothetical protein MLD38_032667 [Melastoma candidum]|uniref:Uncharacterized protein n=1 Tax=Melastoma candidum TaxID=119954 RepID=A0ACB9M4D3_9MYRT|nr:hypothetical protein MLD38_032667 [Melastoma candidum]